MSITILRSPPYLTIQDFGRKEFRKVGVPRCGAMDRAALGTANAVLGNNPDCAGLEWALGGGSVQFNDASTIAIGGASVDAELNGKPVEPFTAVSASPGDTLHVRGFKTGRFLYVAFAGGVDVEQLLGSRSTYLPAHFGGIEGRMIRSGEKIRIAAGMASSSNFSAPSELRPDYSRRSIRVVPGPQWNLFPETDRALFFGQTYSVSRASDRMGYRLEGKTLSASLGLLPSEPVTEGAIQIPPEGVPIVLMADSPTVGGYPKIGVVASADLPTLAQLTPGERFQFEQCSVQDAQRRLRRSAASMHTIRSLATR